MSANDVWQERRSASPTSLADYRPTRSSSPRTRQGRLVEARQERRSARPRSALVEALAGPWRVEATPPFAAPPFTLAALQLEPRSACEVVMDMMGGAWYKILYPAPPKQEHAALGCNFPATVQRRVSYVNGAAAIREDGASNACQINWLTQRHEAVFTLQSCNDRPPVGPLRARYAERVRSQSRKANHRERPGCVRACDERR
eukprot:scaffold39146_cov67-Phaeocystis_antarctica.AAC.1